MSTSRRTDQGSGPDPVRIGPSSSAAGPVSEPTPPEEFAAKLLELYQAAGKPRYAVLIYQAAQQKPNPVRLSNQSLSDWLRGKAVPAKKAAVRFLVAYLEARAARRGYHVRGRDWWATLHNRAWEFKQASRGGRPPTPTTVATTTGHPLRERVGSRDTPEVAPPAVTRSIIDAAGDLQTVLGATADVVRRTALERLLLDLQAVHGDYLMMFESILEQIPDAWERGAPHFAAGVRAAAGRLRRLRLQYEPVRVRLQVAADAFGCADLAAPEREFVAAVLAYFPTGELRLDDVGPWTSGTAVIDHLYCSLDGELGQDLGGFVNNTLVFHRQRWLQVCRAYAAMQVGGSAGTAG